MKSLTTLIKLHKKKLDDLHREIVALEDKKVECQSTLSNLKDQMLQEQENYKGSEYIFALDNYIKDCRKKEKLLELDIKNLTEQISKARDKLREQFSELKKYEIALQNRINLQKEKDRAVENKLLDEFNTINFNINKDG